MGKGGGRRRTEHLHAGESKIRWYGQPTVTSNQVQSSAITSCHEPIGFRQPNRCLMTIKADSSRSALASLGEVKTGFEKENHASILARSTSSSSGMASQSGVFCRRAGRPKLRQGVPN